MSDENGNMHHENVQEDVIRRACDGDSAALGEIIGHYTDYVKAVILSVASDFDLTADEIPVDDLAQIVWVKFITRQFRKFKKLD